MVSDFNTHLNSCLEQSNLSQNMMTGSVQLNCIGPDGLDHNEFSRHRNVIFIYKKDQAIKDLS